MFKHGVLACLTGSLLSLAALAAEDAKLPPAPTQSPAATTQPTAANAEAAPAVRKKAGTSQARRDLRHCLKRASNAEIIRCAE